MRDIRVATVDDRQSDVYLADLGGIK